MDESKTRLFGQGPYPFTPRQLAMVAHRFANSTLAYVTTPPEGVVFQPGTHCHESYEFVVPDRPFPATHINKRVIAPQRGMLLPINAENDHGPAADCQGAQFVAWMIDKDLVGEVAKAEWGVSQVEFLEAYGCYNQETRVLIDTFQTECNLSNPGQRFILDSLSVQIVVSLLRHLPSNLRLECPLKLASARKEISRALEYIRSQVQKDYSLVDVAQAVNLSPYHFARLFKQEIGITPYEYFLRVRVDQACGLLRKSSLSITQICYDVGFHNLNHFTTAFKRIVGITPTAYRRQI